jgi:uncharacterized membrane protein YkvA (DUF1232 family)
MAFRHKEDCMPQAHTHNKAMSREANNGQTATHDESEEHGSEEKQHPVLEKLKGKLEHLTKQTRMEHLSKVVANRARITKELRSIPGRMQKVTNQATLLLELVDDFRDNKYREVSWLSIAIAAGSLLYAVSPGDVVPDFLPGLGQLDDVLVLGIALRFIKNDLKAYCRFKGYEPEKYF